MGKMKDQFVFARKLQRWFGPRLRGHSGHCAGSPRKVDVKAVHCDGDDQIDQSAVECVAEDPNAKRNRNTVFELSKKIRFDIDDLGLGCSIRLEDLASVSAERFAISVVPLRVDIILVDHFSKGDQRFSIIFEDSFDVGGCQELSISMVGTHQIVSLAGENVLSMKCHLQLEPSMFRVIAFAALTHRCDLN